MFAGGGADRFVPSGVASAEDLVVGFKQGSDKLLLPDAAATLETAQYGAWGTTLALGNDATIVVFGTKLGMNDLQQV